MREAPPGAAQGPLRAAIELTSAPVAGPADTSYNTPVAAVPRDVSLSAMPRIAQNHFSFARRLRNLLPLERAGESHRSPRSGTHSRWEGACKPGRDPY